MRPSQSVKRRDSSHVRDRPPLPIVPARPIKARPMERLLLVLDELDDVVSVVRHVWLGVSADITRFFGWATIVVLRGALAYAASV